MERRQRRHFSPREKVKILRLHLLEGRPVSAVCEEHGIHPTLFYQWQKALFRERGSGSFRAVDKRAERQSECAEISQLRGTSCRAEGRGSCGDRRGDGPLKKRAWGTSDPAHGFPTTCRTRSSTTSPAGPNARRSPVQRFVTWLGVVASKSLPDSHPIRPGR